MLSVDEFLRSNMFVVIASLVKEKLKNHKNDDNDQKRDTKLRKKTHESKKKTENEENK